MLYLHSSGGRDIGFHVMRLIEKFGKGDAFRRVVDFSGISQVTAALCKIKICHPAMAVILSAKGSMLLIGSLVLGGLLGEWIDIEKRMDSPGIVPCWRSKPCWTL